MRKATTAPNAATATVTARCAVCGQSKHLGEMVPSALVHPSVVETIRHEHPDFDAGGGSYICLSDLCHYRAKHVQEVLEAEKREVEKLDAAIARSLKEQELQAKDINREFDQKLTTGERIADKVAEFGGSWRFIINFGIIIAVWMAINSGYLLLNKPFDPYPFILLNLVLSCLAALQAPVIMMSQNRQEAKDRLRAENDYRVNLKAELEIRNLNAKMDQLLAHQWQRLLEIQQIQMEMLEEMMEKREEESGVNEQA